MQRSVNGFRLTMLNSGLMYLSSFTDTQLRFWHLTPKPRSYTGYLGRLLPALSLRPASPLAAPSRRLISAILTGTPRAACLKYMARGSASSS